jgi:hypothetical protein
MRVVNRAILQEMPKDELGVAEKKLRDVQSKIVDLVNAGEALLQQISDERKAGRGPGMLAGVQRRIFRKATELSKVKLEAERKLYTLTNKNKGEN